MFLMQWWIADMHLYIPWQTGWRVNLSLVQFKLQSFSKCFPDMKKHLQFSQTNSAGTRVLDVVSSIRVALEHHTKVSFCAGMSDFCSPLALMFADEGDAFWCFERIMSRVVLPPFFSFSKISNHSVLLLPAVRRRLSSILYLETHLLPVCFESPMVMFSSCQKV